MWQVHPEDVYILQLLVMNLGMKFSIVEKTLFYYQWDQTLSYVIKSNEVLGNRIS